MKFTPDGKVRIGIIGLGAIGSFLMTELKTEKYLEVIAAADLDEAKRKETAAAYPGVYLTDDYRTFPPEVDVYVECATTSVADEIAKYAIEKGKVAIIASVGGLSDIRPLRRLARETGGHLYIPSGAIAGLDALKAIPSESIQEVRLTTTKNAASFINNPYVIAKGTKLEGITKPMVIFDGNAGDAVKAFPKNINVSAILSYAGIGREDTHVVIIADPFTKVNRHEVYIKSEHGEIKVEVNNVPFELNPSTSKLAAFSILAAVKSLVYTISIG